jgi:hypothetical protein
MAELFTTTLNGKTHPDAHVVVGSSADKHRYLVALDAPDLGHAEGLTEGERTALLAEIAAIGDIAPRLVPEAPPERTYADNRRRRMPAMSQQMEALWDFIEDTGLSLPPKTQAVLDSINAIKAAHPKP